MQQIVQMLNLAEQIGKHETQQWSLEEWQRCNESIYADILPVQYETCFGNPEYAVKELGEVHGRILSFLYTEIRGLIVFAFEQVWEEGTDQPKEQQIKDAFYWYVSDYSDQTITYRIREAVDPSLDFAARIIMEEDLSDLRYLYKYGEYITDSIVDTARFLNSLPQEEIDRIASVYTEGYRMGFVLGNKDLSKKKTVNIRYILGF